LVFLIAPQVSAQVSVERVLPDKCEFGDNVQVTLIMSVGENVPSGAIIVEELCENLTYVSSEPEGVFRENTRELEWLFYGKDVTAREITYVVVPENGGEFRFSGVVKTARGMMLTTKGITGDNVLTVYVKHLPTEGFPAVVLVVALAVLIIVSSLGFLLKKYRGKSR
jgi:hypothetical protein